MSYRYRIVNNFNRNKDRYKDGKHFLSLEDAEKRIFIDLNQIELGSKNAKTLYLWSEKGAWLHAKSLNTDSAWEAYELLVDDYYSVKKQDIDSARLSPEMQMFKHVFDGVAKMQIENSKLQLQLKTITEKTLKVEEFVTNVKETFFQRDKNWRKSINGMLTAASTRNGGNYSDMRNESYRILDERAGCKLSTRLKNLKDRLYESGASKTKIDDANRMDVIEEDKRLREIYSNIVKELSIGTL